MKQSGFLLLPIFLLTAWGSCWGGEAQRFTIPIDDTAPILLDSDYFSVSLLSGWVYAKSGFFKRALSKKSKFIVSLDGKCEYFDGESTHVATMHQNSDINKNTNRAWGINHNIILNTPADANCEIGAKVLINNEDLFTNVFNALKSAETPLGDSFDPAWSGYAGALTQLSSYFFGVGQDDIPFVWSGNIKLGDINDSSEMREHYIVLISPNKEGAAVAIDGRNLAYDERSGILTNNGQQLDEFSYSVFKVAKASGYDVRQLIFASSAPWAVLARSFLVFPIQSAANEPALNAVAEGLLANFQKEIELLNKEKRFSKLDRATVLLKFAMNAESQIQERCTNLSIQDNCPSGSIRAFIDTIADIFGISNDQYQKLIFRANAISLH